MEEAAKVALGLMGATAILGAIGLVAGFMKKNVLRATVALAWTNNLGGQIQHSEIGTNGTPGKAPSGNVREHDD